LVPHPCFLKGAGSDFFIRWVSTPDSRSVGKQKAERLCSACESQMVAGDRNVLKIPAIPFSFEIIRPVAA
jgi:hypothetical protein